MKSLDRKTKVRDRALGISATDAKSSKLLLCLRVFVDYQIGRIINTLKERGMYDDTLIIFTSDHGECLGDYNSMGKRTMLDAAAHIPMIMHVPGRRQETRRDVCSLVDVAPTILSWAGIDYDPAEYDGVDLLRGRHDYVLAVQRQRERRRLHDCRGL